MDSSTAARLRRIADEVAELLAPLQGRRHTPPVRSQDRRRLGARADAVVDALNDIATEINDRPGPSIAAGHGPQASPSDPLTDVARQQAAIEAAETRLRAAVARARGEGASWRRIGEALGVAAQTAHKRFDPVARRRHAEYMRARYRRVGQT